MTKRQWIELIIDYLAGGACPADLRGKYHPRVVEELFGLVYSDIIYQVHANAVRYKDFSQFDNYVKSYGNVPVLYDQDRDEYYSVIPGAFINLPENRGIRMVAPMQSQKDKLWYTENNNADVREELEGQIVVNYMSYYIESGKTYYRNFDSTFTKFLFKLVSPVSAFDDEDQLGLPATQATSVFNMLTDMLRKRPMEKQTNDNANV